LYSFFLIGWSYNQPSISQSNVWSRHGITLINSDWLQWSTENLFVDINNTIYVPVSNSHGVQVWPDGSSTPIRNLSVGSDSPSAVFSTINGDVYTSDSQYHHPIKKWVLNETAAVNVMNTTDACFSLFVDIHDALYCSLHRMHFVIKYVLNNDRNQTTIVAGDSIHGSTNYLLNEPRGIFVDIDLTLYVADCNNHRIQQFPFGQLNATTLFSNGASGVMYLNCPTALVLDANKNIFIADIFNNRIVRFANGGLVCIIGCTGGGGSASHHLNQPRSLNFDSSGNLIVLDRYNHRIQKFLLQQVSRGEYTVNRTFSLLISDSRKPYPEKKAT
jgi:sugar lactone lactonase YvrE